MTATETERSPNIEHAGRPIAFPHVRTFGELFTEHKPYDKNMKSVMSWPSWEAGTWSDPKRSAVTHLSTYLRVNDRRSDEAPFRAFSVKPSIEVIEWIGANTLHVPYDTKTFEIVVWDDGQALVVCAAGQIIANYYLAIIDAATIPAAIVEPDPPKSEPRTTSEVKGEKMAAERSRYMDGEISHDEYYLWLSDWIGLPDSLIPATIDEIRASNDEHFNDIRLQRWDAMDKSVRAYAGGLYWSLSDTVCCLKAMARRRRDRVS